MRGRVRHTRRQQLSNHLSLLRDTWYLKYHARVQLASVYRQQVGMPLVATILDLSRLRRLLFFVIINGAYEIRLLILISVPGMRVPYVDG